MSLSRHSSGGYLGWTIRALWAIAALSGSTAFAQVSFDDDLFGVRIDARQPTTLWGYTQIRNPAATAADPATRFFSGLFRSTDNGATWTSLRVPWQRARIRQVELDPLASGVAYVLVWAGRQYMWRTQDGGANWTALTTGLPENGAPLASLYVHGNPAAVYLQLGNMLYKSADGGQSFRPLGANGCASRVEHNRTDPRRLYCGSVNGDILSSADEGLTWTPGGRIPIGRPGVLVSNDGIQVLSDPARPGLLLISVWGVTNSGSGDSIFDAVYRSPDGGRTFARLNPMPSLHTLQASPDRRLVFVTGTGADFIRSRNFGDSWEQMSSPVGQLGDLGF
ncbi:MAG: hypothetical protein JNN08_11940, partial [Bryobacterales bacterium]|nr:hypothetical protein [Bryobacterales bacterium]